MGSVVRAHDSAGVLVLDLSAPASGYSTLARPDIERAWQGQTNESWAVDGEDVLDERLLAVTKAFRTRIKGSTWAEVEARYEALIAAIEQPPGWNLVIGRGGVDRTYLCNGRASSSAPDSLADEANGVRIVNWNVRTQPTPIVTGL